MSFMKNFDYLKIQMEDIVSATNNFDPTMVIGRGGFGKVYKGELSSTEGQISVAFKKLDRRFGQGNIEFWKEIMMLSRYKHENLISLMHFCIDGDEMILVYEYASRGSLDQYLTDADTLNWIQRLRICVGAARGMRFLHDPKETQQRVLHRDIKSSNILLDENWKDKVSDFGLSKVGPANQAHAYLVSHGVGTPGYCDPLYMELGFLSKELDVYSFGVVLFEVLCGRLCYEYSNHDLTKILVPKWRRCYDEKRLDEIIHPGLKEQMHPGSLKSFSAIAYECVKKDREDGQQWAEIVEELEFSLEQQVIFQNTPKSNSHRERTNSMHTSQLDRSQVNDRRFKLESRFQDRPYNGYYQATSSGDSVRLDNYDSEDGPGIEHLKIVGDAKPGGKLLARGFPVRGTSVCMFQWVRRLEDGTRKYIHGATNPEYVVTADDVDKFIAVECIPIDDYCRQYVSRMLKTFGYQGGLVRLFANEQKKMSCDAEMQQEIENYISVGRASFSALLVQYLLLINS